MTKKELLKAVKTCKEVKAIVHINKDFCMYAKVVKADFVWNFKYETEDSPADADYHAQMLSDNVLLVG